METDNIIDLGITPQSVYYNDLVERAISFNNLKFQVIMIIKIICS